MLLLAGIEVFLYIYIYIHTHTRMANLKMLTLYRKQIRVSVSAERARQ